MREHEKYTIAKTKSGNLIVPIAILKNWFGQDLQDLIDSHRFYSIGMMSSEETYISFTRTVEHNFPYAQPRSFSEKLEYAQWYASKKFIEESVGLLHLYMVRLNSSIYVVKNKEEEDKQILVENLENEKIRFDRFDFPTKIKKLRAYSSDTVKLENEARSLNKARNCLVHRRGVVSRDDANDNNKNLIVKWRTIRMDDKNNSFVSLEKKYEVGSTIVFDYEKCMDTMYTLIGYYNVLFNQCITSIGLDENDAFYEFKT